MEVLFQHLSIKDFKFTSIFVATCVSKSTEENCLNLPIENAFKVLRCFQMDKVTKFTFLSDKHLFCYHLINQLSSLKLWKNFFFL